MRRSTAFATLPILSFIFFSYSSFLLFLVSFLMGRFRGKWCTLARLVLLLSSFARRGVNNGVAQRAGDGGRAYPANRHRVCIITRSCVRRLPILIPIGAAFGYGTRTHTLSRILPGCGAAQSTVRRQSARAREHRLGTPGLAKPPDGSTEKCRFSTGRLGPDARARVLSVGLPRDVRYRPIRLFCPTHHPPGGKDCP